MPSNGARTSLRFRCGPAPVPVPRPVAPAGWLAASLAGCPAGPPLGGGQDEGVTPTLAAALAAGPLVLDGGLSTELEARGAEFSGPPEDLGFGIAASLKLPGAGEMLVYQPRHPEAHSL